MRRAIDLYDGPATTIDGTGDDDPLDVTCPECRSVVVVTWATKYAACPCGCVWGPTLFDIFPPSTQRAFERLGWVE